MVFGIECQFTVSEQSSRFKYHLLNFCITEGTNQSSPVLCFSFYRLPAHDNRRYSVRKGRNSSLRTSPARCFWRSFSAYPPTSQTPLEHAGNWPCRSNSYYMADDTRTLSCFDYPVLTVLKRSAKDGTGNTIAIKVSRHDLIISTRSRPSIKLLCK